MSSRDWKERIMARYQELKKLGRPFFPDIIFKDTVAVFFVFIAVFILAYALGADLEEMADPTDTTYNPRPEWYFLFLFQALKFFPGALEPVAAIILPSLAIIFLLFLPFIDRGPKRHWLDRKILTSMGLMAAGGFAVLTYLGIKSPLLNPVVHKDPQVIAGRKLYNDLRCAYCHSIQGRGGKAAPDLSTVGAKREREWLVRHFQDPQAVTPGSLMPQFHLLPAEVEDVVAFLMTLGGGVGPYSPDASKLFAEHCSSCHILDGKGGDMGPDLSAIRTYREKNYVTDYVRDPAKMNRDATMPGFSDSLTHEQIEDIARYLFSTEKKR